MSSRRCEPRPSLLVVFAVISPVKVQNMILGGGIFLKAAARPATPWPSTSLVPGASGVPLGFLAAFVLKLPVAPVYFCSRWKNVSAWRSRCGCSKKRIWMQQL